MSRYLKNSSDNSDSDEEENEEEDTDTDDDEIDEEISFYNTRDDAEWVEWSPPFIYDPYNTVSGAATIKPKQEKKKKQPMMRSLADFPVVDILHYSPILRSTNTSPFWGQTEILEEMGGDLSNTDCETLARHWRIEENKACLSPYQVVDSNRALSAGLQAQVFKGLDNKDGSAIAIRYVPLANALREKEFQTQIQLQRLLLCRILSRTCNASVSEIKDAFLCLQNGKKYGIVIMKLYDGDVWSLLLNYPPAQEPSEKQIFFQSIEKRVLVLVRNLHQCDIWHRDIHLGNILYLCNDKDQKYKLNNNNNSAEEEALKLYLTDFDESKSRSSLSSDREKSSFPFALEEEYTNAAEETRMDLAAISDFIERKADFATESSSLTPQQKREAIALFFSNPLYKNINQQLKKRMLDSLKK